MKKLMILGCAFFFVFCMTKKPTVKTDGLEEVVVFGEDTTTQAPTEEALVPPAEPAPTVAEAVTAPPVTETITPPPVEEVASLPPVVPPPVTPTAVSEEPVAALTPAPTEEVASAAPVVPPPAAVSEEPAPGSAPVAAMVPSPSAPPALPQGSVYGFRVQIFASSTEKNAMKIVDDARSAFGGRIYIEHLAPYFKVRIGDCLTKEDAQGLKDKAVSMGYRGAFIVETMINP